MVKEKYMLFRHGYPAVICQSKSDIEELFLSYVEEDAYLHFCKAINGGIEAEDYFSNIVKQDRKCMESFQWTNKEIKTIEYFTLYWYGIRPNRYLIRRSYELN